MIMMDGILVEMRIVEMREYSLPETMIVAYFGLKKFTTRRMKILAGWQ